MHAVVPDHELLETALWARKLRRSRRSPSSRSRRVSHKGDLDEGIAAEKQGFGTAFGSEDAKEGISAFIQKRTARFQGK